MDQEVCQHSWVAGMMYVHSEDLESVARERAANGSSPVECEKCERVYEVPNKPRKPLSRSLGAIIPR